MVSLPPFARRSATHVSFLPALPMLLYHGSNLAVERPRLLARTRALDFGAGFYLTTDPDQAARWARTTVLRRGSFKEARTP